VVLRLRRRLINDFRRLLIFGFRRRLIILRNIGRLLLIKLHEVAEGSHRLHSGLHFVRDGMTGFGEVAGGAAGIADGHLADGRLRSSSLRSAALLPFCRTLAPGRGGRCGAAIFATRRAAFAGGRSPCGLAGRGGVLRPLAAGGTMVSETRRRSLSTSITHTRRLSPTATTSCGSRTNLSARRADGYQAAIVHAMSTKQPKSTTLSTVPVSSMPRERSSILITPRLNTGRGRSSRGSRRVGPTGPNVPSAQLGRPRVLGQRPSNPLWQRVRTAPRSSPCWPNRPRSPDPFKARWQPRSFPDGLQVASRGLSPAGILRKPAAWTNVASPNPGTIA